MDEDGKNKRRARKEKKKLQRVVFSANFEPLFKAMERSREGEVQENDKGKERT